MNLGIIRKINPIRTESDPDREEIRAKGKELFSGRTINWDKLGIAGYIRSRISEDYAQKVKEEFKNYVNGKLVKNMNSRPQTYLNNNLNELKQSIQHIDDLSQEDIKELGSIINEREAGLAIKHFAGKKKDLIIGLIERGRLSAEEVSVFLNNHPEYDELKSIEEFGEFKSALYGEFKVPMGDRV